MNQLDCLSTTPDCIAQGGRFWLSFADLAKLLARDGEAAAAVEVKRQPAATAAEVA